MEKNPTTEGADQNVGAAGLDIGTSRIVLVKGTGKQQSQSQSQLNAFLTVPYSKMTESTLQQNRVTYYKNSSELYVYGNDSERFASVFNSAPRRPMQLGVMNAHEVMGQQMIQSIIGMVLPRTGKKELLCFSVPGGGGSSSNGSNGASRLNGNLVYHESVLKSFLESLGYEARAVNEGLAVVFSELQKENYTGIGISCGGGLCNVSLSFLSVPVFSFSIAKAGDYIDTNAAAAAGEPVPRVRLFKEESLDLSAAPNDKLTSALHVYYDEVLRSLIAQLREEFAKARSIPKLDRPIPIVLSGGTSKPPGFLQKFERMIRESDFPVPISEVRLASDPLTATARGCHIAAMSEAQ